MFLEEGNMLTIFNELSFDKEDIETLREIYKDFSDVLIQRIINVLAKYGCSIDYIKHLLLNNKNLFLMDVDRLQYLLEAIVSNGDTIEEVLLEII